MIEIPPKVRDLMTTIAQSVDTNVKSITVTRADSGSISTSINGPVEAVKNVSLEIGTLLDAVISMHGQDADHKCGYTLSFTREAGAVTHARLRPTYSFEIPIPHTGQETLPIDEQDDDDDEAAAQAEADAEDAADEAVREAEEDDDEEDEMPDIDDEDDDLDEENAGGLNFGDGAGEPEVIRG